MLYTKKAVKANIKGTLMRVKAAKYFFPKQLISCLIWEKYQAILKENILEPKVLFKHPQRIHWLEQNTSDSSARNPTNNYSVTMNIPQKPIAQELVQLSYG